VKVLGLRLGLVRLVLGLILPVGKCQIIRVALIGPCTVVNLG
jgi:hypothetical protein